jgi:membrane carboxypeptidase/penicillin-binding protein
LRLSFGFASAVSLVAIVLLLAAALTYASLTSDLPALDALPALLDPDSGLLLQPTRLYDRSGQNLLLTLAASETERVFIPYDQLPKSLVDASLALFQPDFWESPGYVISGWQDPATHPTLTQQLVSDFLLADELPAPRRAIHERLLAAQVIARFGREQVLEWVLNSADFGNLAYGVDAAARLYLGKPVSELSLGESALLAAVAQAPALNPFDAPLAAEANRQAALASLLDLGWISEEQAQASRQTAPEIQAWPSTSSGLGVAGVSPQYLDLLLSQLDASFGAGRIQRGGAQVLTSLDYDLQLQADCLLRSELARLAGDPVPSTAGDGSPCVAVSLLAASEAVDAQTSGGVLLLDPATGQVLAAAGDLLSHPAGTSITPFLYLAGFARGLSPASLGWDLPGGTPVLGQVYQGPVRLRLALANDYLPLAQTVLAQVGLENVRTTAASFGLELPAGGLLERDFELSPFDLAAAHAILAAGGIQTGLAVSPDSLEPATFLRVRRPDGTPWLEASTPGSRLVVSPQLAYLLNNVLSDESARWPSLGHPNPLEIDRPVAARLARSLDGTSAWAIGYTPERVMVVHLSGAGQDSALAAARLWSALARHALRDLPALGWEMPAGIVSLKVCDPSGLLPTRACPQVVDEVFLEGRQPLQTDNLYQIFEIDIETGLLATVFTPPELVESRVYMLPPAQARQWAASVGIETPPTTYDAYQPAQILPNAHITAPQIFSNLGGVVEIRGTAAGEDFVSYRLEAGAGLNPQRWLLLGQESTSPVSEGVLAEWDTSGLDGLYALRLLVVRADRHVDQALSQVTLDNTPPQVQILQPQEGEEIALDEAPVLVFRADVQEAFLEQVTFWLDGEQLAQVNAAPFAAIWTPLTGEHFLRVSATDLAGNSSEAGLHFSVHK